MLFFKRFLTVLLVLQIVSSCQKTGIIQSGQILRHNCSQKFKKFQQRFHKKTVILLQWYFFLSFSSSVSVFVYNQHLFFSVWNTSGCSLKSFTDTQVTCTCNHLTNFAILMSLTKTPSVNNLTNIIQYNIIVFCFLIILRSLCLVFLVGVFCRLSLKKINYINFQSHSQALTLITYIGCSFSVLGALATIVIYLYFWRYFYFFQNHLKNNVFYLQLNVIKRTPKVNLHLTRLELNNHMKNTCKFLSF